MWTFYNASGVAKTTLVPDYVTALPSSPVDGQEVYYAADATNGVIWHLRYRSGSSSSYKWEFVGGSPLHALTAAESSRANTSYGLLADAVSTSVTLPLAGDYDITIGARSYITANAGAALSFKIGTTEAVDADGLDIYQLSAGTGTIPQHMTVRRKTGLSAVTLELRYKAAAGTIYALNRFIRATPVRVG